MATKNWDTREAVSPFDERPFSLLSKRFPITFLLPVGLMAHLAIMTTFVLGLAMVRPAVATVRTITLNLTDTPQGHFAFGQAIGMRFKSDLTTVLAHPGDPELRRLVAYVTDDPEGQAVFASLVKTAKGWAPLYYEEVKGMSAGSGVNMTALLVNQFREELVQFAPSTAKWRRVGKCSSAFLNVDGVLALGHNDDWTQNWRNLSYWVIAHDGATGDFLWGTSNKQLPV